MLTILVTYVTCATNLLCVLCILLLLWLMHYTDSFYNRKGTGYGGGFFPPPHTVNVLCTPGGSSLLLHCREVIIPKLPLEGGVPFLGRPVLQHVQTNTT